MMKKTSFASKYDAEICAPRMRKLYGDNGYFNVGYWDAGVVELSAACNRLVDELASIIPADAEHIVDVGCGVGAGTRRLTDRFPAALVIGANISLWQLQQGRQRGVKAPVVMDAVRLALAEGSVDAVLAVESPQHFDTRLDFLKEAHRVLRPGGMIALADMLFRNPERIGSWMLPPANQIATLTEYAEVLTSARFEVLSVRDVTDICWHRYCDEMRSVFAGHEQNLEAIRDAVSYYVLAFARKPM